MLRNRRLAVLTDTDRHPWWLAGGIPPGACVAAYQPVGASDYAASKINLAKPGTYDAYEGTAPAWDAVSGWKFTNASSHYLRTGLLILLTHSMIVRLSNASSGVYCICGEYKATPRQAHRILPNRNNLVYYGDTTQAPGCAQGVLAMCGTNGYRDGVLDKTPISIGTADATYEYYMGGQNQEGSLVAAYDGYIQAFATYNYVLTDIQVAALTAAMNAL